MAKVEYINYIKSIPTEEARNAEFLLFRRKAEESQRVLLQAKPPLVYRAIKMNIRLSRWAAALDIAIKYKTHLDTVLAYRNRHLEQVSQKYR